MQCFHILQREMNRIDERFNKLKEEYDNYPLIVNFKNSKEEVKIYFEEIKVELDLEWLLLLLDLLPLINQI